MRALAGLLLTLVALPAWSQDFACGPFKAGSRKTGAETEWTIVLGKDKASERAALKSGPRFECIAGEVLVVEFTTAANTFVGLHFPDGNEIGYGGQILRRNNRFVLPIQAKARMASKYRSAFDYHCKLVMPGDPIPEVSRAECVF